MLQFGGKDSKRHFTVVMGNKEHGLYVSSSPSSAAKKAVTKLCASNKGKEVKFYIREITQGSKKKTYGPYLGQVEKLKEPIKLKGRIIQYKSVAKLSEKTDKKMRGGDGETNNDNIGNMTRNLFENHPITNEELKQKVNKLKRNTQQLKGNLKKIHPEINFNKTKSNEQNLSNSGPKNNSNQSSSGPKNNSNQSSSGPRNNSNQSSSGPRNNSNQSSSGPRNNSNQSSSGPKNNSNQSSSGTKNNSNQSSSGPKNNSNPFNSVVNAKPFKNPFNSVVNAPELVPGTPQ
jgi:hypothetical protein